MNINEKILVCTPAFYPDIDTQHIGSLRVLLDSCADQGISTLPFGLGHQGGYEGGDNSLYGYKIKGFNQFLKTQQDKYEYVLMFDASDVIVVGTLQEFWDNYITFNADIVIGAEKDCAPENYCRRRFPKPTEYNNYPNSGTIFGRMDSLIQSLDIIETRKEEVALDIHRHLIKKGWRKYFEPTKMNDQAHWMSAMAHGLVNAVLDRNALMFMTMHSTTPDMYSFSQGRLHNNITHTTPQALHFNGLYKDLIPGVLTKIVESRTPSDA